MTGLLKHAIDGGSIGYKHADGGATMIPIDVQRGCGSGRWTSFPAAAFERAVRSKLAEVTTGDITGEDKSAEKVKGLRGQKVELEALVKLWTAKMDVPAIVDKVAAKLAELDGQLKKKNTELAEAERDAANPLANAWNEARTLAGMNPDHDTDELRVNIRAALRRCIEGVYCVFVTRHRTRYAAVRVQFRTGAHRDYLVTAVDRGRRCSVASHTWPTESGPLDLRNPGDAKLVETALTKLASASRPA